MAINESPGLEPRWREENYRLLAENSADLIARISIDGICLYISPSCVELLGYSPEELTGRRVFDYIHPLDRKAVTDSIEPEILFRSHKKTLFRLRRKDGYYGWFESRFQIFGDMVTRRLQIAAVARDVGDRIRAERFVRVRYSIATLKADETDLEKKFASFLETICTTLTWDIGEIWLVEEGEVLLKLHSLWHAPSARLRRFSASLPNQTLAPGVGLPGALWSRGKVSLVNDLPSLHSSVRKKEYEEAGLKAAIGTVLNDEARVYGVILFLSRRNIQRNQELLDMVAEMGTELGGFIAKYRARKSFETESEKLGLLVEEGSARIRALQAEVSRQQRLEQEILMAAEVQRNLLPTTDPALPDFDFSSAAIPARYISGDLYDFAAPSPSTCDIIIADVSGKGIAAAMLTTAARTIFHNSDRAEKSPARLLEEMNGALYADLERTEMFLTAQLIRIDGARGSVSYASAGHTEALRYTPSSGACVRFPSTAPPIGIARDIEVGQMEIRMRPGDFFVLYSDGVTEAENEEGELFGMERFTGILYSRDFGSAADLAHAVLTEVRGFSGGKPLADDLTLIVIRATSRNASLRTPAVMDRLDDAIAFVRDAALPYGASAADDMELAASELVTNAIKHARPWTAETPADVGVPGALELSLSLEPDRIVFDLFYPGEGFDPEAGTRTLPGPLQEGGRGLHIVRALVDELKYTHLPAEAEGAGGFGKGGRGPAPGPMNHWHIVKTIPREKKV